MKRQSQPSRKASAERLLALGISNRDGMKSGDTLRGIAQQTRSKTTVRSERASVDITDTTRNDMDADNLRRSQSLHNPIKHEVIQRHPEESRIARSEDTPPKRKSWKGSPLRLFGRSKTKTRLPVTPTHDE